MRHFALAQPFKVYPRDIRYPGRVRVRLVDEDDQPCNAEVPTRNTHSAPLVPCVEFSAPTATHHTLLVECRVCQAAS